MKACKDKEDKHAIKIDDTEYTTNDPIIDGREILKTAGKRPYKNFIVFQLLKDGQLEEIRQDEKVDLRERGIETFITFESDRCFRFKIEDRVFTWGFHLISGRWLYRLGGFNPKTTTLFLISVGGEDKEVKAKDIIDLSDKEVECFQPRTKFSICIIPFRVSCTRSDCTGDGNPLVVCALVIETKRRESVAIASVSA